MDKKATQIFKEATQTQLAVIADLERLSEGNVKAAVELLSHYKDKEHQLSRIMDLVEEEVKCSKLVSRQLRGFVRHICGEEERDCPFLIDVWRGDVYVGSGYPGLKELVRELETTKITLDEWFDHPPGSSKPKPAPAPAPTSTPSRQVEPVSKSKPGVLSVPKKRAVAK